MPEGEKKVYLSTQTQGVLENMEFSTKGVMN